jgi:hypothetical protein
MPRSPQQVPVALKESKVSDNRSNGSEPTTAVWREQALVEISARRFSADRLKGVDAQTMAKIQSSLKNAHDAAVGSGLTRRQRLASSLRGASVERTWGQLNAADEAMLRAGSDEYVRGQLPRVLGRVRRALPADDARRAAVEEIARQQPNSPDAGSERSVLLNTLSKRLSDGVVDIQDATTILGALGRNQAPCKLEQSERDALNAAFHAANCEARKKQTRVRSFRNMLFGAALVLSIAAILLALVGFADPRLLPICYTPSGQVVCATDMDVVDENGTATGQPAASESTRQQATQDDKARDLANKPDILLVEGVGLIAAAVAAAAALRGLKGTSNPYGVPFALAVLKLPTGALTAVLGLLLMRGQFVPGLSALDSPAQIIAWAIVFGYAQQLFTRFVDQRAQSVLDSAGDLPARREPSERAPAVAAAPAPATA